MRASRWFRVALFATAACSGEEEPSMAQTITIRSEAFDAGQRIPQRHAYRGEGENVSPPLAWEGVPDGAKQLALLCDDPDAPTDEPWVHWVLFGLPADTRALPAGLPGEGDVTGPVTARQGKNSWDELGWGGPLPPEGHGTHHYHFKLYALDAPIDLERGATKKELLAAIEGHVLAQGELIGTYER